MKFFARYKPLKGAIQGRIGLPQPPNSFNNWVSEIQDLGGLAITQRWLLDNMARVQSYDGYKILIRAK